MTKKLNFYELMQKTKCLSGDDIKKDLNKMFIGTRFLKCPVPNCESPAEYQSWGTLFDHFLDSNHKKDYFDAFLKAKKQPFAASRGPDFSRGVCALISSMIYQPTSLEELRKLNTKKPTTPPPIKTSPETQEGPKSGRQLPEQQSLLVEVSKPQKASEEVVGNLVLNGGFKFKSAFAKVSELIRESDEINKLWRGKVLDEYVEMFHGIPPCFHCRSAEGKQIHHQNPLFYEIVLISLNKLATTAEEVVGAANDMPLKKLIKEVYDYHMKPGRVCAVPYCSSCNQDAENKRRNGKN